MTNEIPLETIYSTENKSNSRSANIEILRIIAIFFIICHHILNYIDCPPEFIFKVVNSLFSPSVNIFVIISGYFLVNSKFKPKKILNLYFQIVFYYLLTYTLFNMSGGGVELFKCFLPFLYPQEWFTICYVILYLISPLLNIIIHNISNKTHVIIILCMMLLSYLQRFPGIESYLNINYGYSVFHFITLYFIAAYIRLYFKKGMIKNKWLVLAIIISYLYIIFCYYFRDKISILYLVGPNFIYSKYIAYSSIVVTTLSILVFILFLNFKIDNLVISKIINKVSSITFGIYLIHSSTGGRIFIENFIKANNHYFVEELAFLYILLVALGIVVIGFIIDLIRQIIFKVVKRVLMHHKNGTIK